MCEGVKGYISTSVSSYTDVTISNGTFTVGQQIIFVNAASENNQGSLKFSPQLNFGVNTTTPSAVSTGMGIIKRFVYAPHTYGGVSRYWIGS